MTKTNEASTKAGPGVQLGGELGSYNRIGKLGQRRIIPPLNAGTCISTWEAQLVPALFDAVELVRKDLLGPVHLLGDDGGPRVCIGYRQTASFVWLERRPWGATWANANKQFIDQDHIASAVKYALKLTRAIRQLSLDAEMRLERVKAAYLREKFGGEL